MDEPFVGVDAATEDAHFTVVARDEESRQDVIIVHHDLQTANEYFDHIVLLNTRLVAAGPKDEVFTKELLQEAYGGRLTVLSKLGDLISTEEFPLREPEFKENKPEK